MGDQKFEAILGYLVSYLEAEQGGAQWQSTCLAFVALTQLLVLQECTQDLQKHLPSRGSGQ